MRSSLPLLSLIALLACEARIPVGNPVHRPPSADAGASDATGEDGDSVEDSAVDNDASANSDAEDQLDGGAPGDAQAVPDAAILPDAEAFADAGPLPDAGEPSADAATLPDAAILPDAEPLGDAGPLPDAAEPLDAGAQPDAAAPLDAGPRADVGPGQWAQEVIEHVPFLNPNTPIPRARIAIGPDGIPQIVYAAVGGSLQPVRPTYARRLPTGWDGETLGTGPGRGYFGDLLNAGLSIAIDGSNNPHVAFTSSTSVIYARRSSRAVWAETALAPSSPFAIGVGDTSIVLDAIGEPIVAYISGQLLFRIYLRRHTAAGWVALGDRVGTAPVVLLDSGGLTYLLYSDTSGNQRTFLRRSATGWAVDRCGQFCGAAPEVVFDAQDNLHYLDGNTHTIWTGTNATRRSIEPQDSVAEGAIAIDPQGGLHFAYRTIQASAAPPKLKYAYDDGQSVRVEDVDVDGDPGYAVDLAVGPDGRPVIVYFDLGDHMLRSAVRN